MHVHPVFPYMALLSGKRPCILLLMREETTLWVPVVGSTDIRGDMTLFVEL
jgi:hypothetical protein